MKFSKSGLDIIYQYAAPTKAETLAGMKEIVPVIKDLLTKAIVENAIRKPGKSPSERGRNYTPLGEVVHCALPGASPLSLRSAQSQRPLDVVRPADSG